MTLMAGVARDCALAFQRFRNFCKILPVDRVGHADHYSRSSFLRFQIGSEIRCLRTAIQNMTKRAMHPELPAKSVHHRHQVVATDVGRQHFHVCKLVGYLDLA